MKLEIKNGIINLLRRLEQIYEVILTVILFCNYDYENIQAICKKIQPLTRNIFDMYEVKIEE